MNPKLKKLMKIIIILLILISIFSWFFYVNSLNYKKIREIKLKQVNHPEWLPTSEFAKATAFWFDNTKADIYWLETIQYVGSNALSSAYKKYLYKILNLVTDLNPYFLHPYKLGMLLLPDYNPRYEDLNEDQKLEYIKQAESLWLKWMKNFCDLKKVEAIKKQDDLQKIWTDEKYKNPCKTYEVPYYLAYIYYFYLKDPKKASDYYKIASANSDSVNWAKILAAIMKWKGWDREKSFLMFLNIWKSLDTSKDKVCSNFADILQNQIWFKIFRENKLDSNLIKYASDSREKLFWKYDEDKDDLKSDSDCENYINKAIRELNLYYVEQANKKYLKDTWKNAKNAKELYDKWYIKYLPTDYQQGEDYWIIYEYDDELVHFDYNMGKY